MKIFDVFLCHNTEDKPIVRQISQELAKEKIKSWLDEVELVPGSSWQAALGQQIESIKSAAVFVGESGIGPWQDQEIQALLSQFIKRGCRIIPVVLPSAKTKPDLPWMLDNLHWVDFRQTHPDPLKQLVWGITGKREKALKADAATQEKQLHDLVERHFLPHHKHQTTLSDSAFRAYDRLFAAISQRSKEAGEEAFFASLRHDIEVHSQTDLTVAGQPGTGKTTLLTVLYWYLRATTDETRETAILPVFISTRHFSQEASATTLLSEMAGFLQKALQVKPRVKVWFLIDGVDGYEELVDRLMYDVLGDASGDRRIIRTANVTSEPTHEIVRLGRVPSKSDDFVALVSSFCQIYDFKEETLLATELRNSRLHFIDLFLLHLYSDEIRPGRTPIRLTQVLERYFVTRAKEQRMFKSENELNALFDSAGDLAFALMANKSLDRSEETDADRTLMRLLKTQHHLISDFLVARQMIVRYVRASESSKPDPRSFAYLFPHHINRLAVDLLTRGGIMNYDAAVLQDKVFCTIQQIVRSPHFNFLAKAHSCYLLGRMSATHASSRAPAELDTILNEIAKAEAPLYGKKRATRRLFALKASASKDVREQYQLFKRTVYVSKAFLGDRRTEDEYIGTLMVNKLADLINRGFHLEYYGDIEFNCEHPLVCKDNLASFSHTLCALSSNIRERCELFHLELYTLASLAQQRHARGKLDEAERQSVEGIIKWALGQGGIESAKLRAYLEFVQQHLGLTKYVYARSSLRFLRLKCEKRAGWQERGIVEDVESVAAHTMGAYLLGLFFLPDHLDGDSVYQKATILDMILVHDLAEAIIGDVTRANRTEDTRKKEQQVYEFIRLLGTYQDAPSLSRIELLWQDFENERTINATIARELDRLDNLVQLWSYRRQGHQIGDFDTWEDQLVGEITSQVMVPILRQIQKYESQGADTADWIWWEARDSRTV